MMTKAKLTLDDQLAEFTDRTLDGGLSAQDEATLAPDLELRALEETVLRLRDAIPNEDPGEEVVSRMWGEIEKESNWKAQKPFRQTLKEIFSPQSNWRSRRTRPKDGHLRFRSQSSRYYSWSSFLSWMESVQGYPARAEDKFHINSSSSYLAF